MSKSKTQLSSVFVTKVREKDTEKRKRKKHKERIVAKAFDGQ